jgi:hypothetical protein
MGATALLKLECQQSKGQMLYKEARDAVYKVRAHFSREPDNGYYL